MVALRNSSDSLKRKRSLFYASGVAIETAAAACARRQKASLFLEQLSKVNHGRAVPDCLQRKAIQIAGDRVEAAPVCGNHVPVGLDHHHIPWIAAEIAGHRLVDVL